ncbi:MAG: UDP-N-acetylmuramate:L-alanyl-gamma-D-glutamyl-meso-diaminopimelate ligase [Chthoniobacterales bacterium]|nr:UDP-N-acetylmuramate:L-alanyl-gamma-D-glutamyl-meso-diaminopimelate ligase [Chthoniobacterales bacterium]
MSSPRRIHFLGICGTAMGAVAAAMKEQGWDVTGSDAAPYPPISDFLASRNIPIAVGFSSDNLPKEESLIVIGNALSRGNPEVEAILNRRLPYISLPELLRTHFLQGRHNLVVTGTHGKTTTSSMLAWIFEFAKKNPSYLIGGIPNNLGQGACFRDRSESHHVILEGDEYDTAFFDKRSKFLHYLPELVIINNIEFDHADIFANLDEIKLSFRRLLKVVPSEGMILINGDDANSRDVAQDAPAPVVEVGFSENCGHRILAPWQEEGRAGFELLGEKFELTMNGEYNIHNGAMAASAAHFYGIPLATIREALLKFQGIKRRQEVIGIINGITIIDDFGHHPTAIRETLAGLHAHYPHARLWALFEPRSNTSRRAVFQNVLPEAFSQAAGVIIGAVARATQLNDEERLHPEQLVADIAATGKPAFYEPATDQIITRVQSLAKPGDVIVIFSNGSFDNLKNKLKNNL